MTKKKSEDNLLVNILIVNPEEIPLDLEDLADILKYSKAECRQIKEIHREILEEKQLYFGMNIGIYSKEFVYNLHLKDAQKDAQEYEFVSGGTVLLRKKYRK